MGRCHGGPGIGERFKVSKEHSVQRGSYADAEALRRLLLKRSPPSMAATRSRHSLRAFLRS